MGVEILRGVEANIIDANGRLDMPASILRHLDLVLAGFHDGCGYESGTVEENTRAMVAALHNPFVHVIVHPGNPDYPVDLERVVQVAKACGKVLEINNKSFTTSRNGSKPNCLRLARLAKKYQVMVVINSDAHVFSSVGVCDEALEVAKEAGLEPDQILNTSAERSLAYLAYRRSLTPGFSLVRELAG
jgi:putative hydrolase